MQQTSEVFLFESSPALEASSKKRISPIDLARGIAIALMILSHGVKGMLNYSQFTDWGLVPIHLITKFSSTLFIVVFGISLAVAYLPYVDTEKWPEKRLKLWVRGGVILFWYKILTFIEMFSIYSRQQILDTLLYKSFPSYVEILGFYGLALLWIPWFLKRWAFMSIWVRISLPIICVMAMVILRNHFDFWGNEILEALFIEHTNHYTWGQLSRAPLIMIGLLMGEWLAQNYHTVKKRIYGAVFLLLVGSSLGGYFVYLNQEDLYSALRLIAFNKGKHPPELDFMLFSSAGALLLMSLSLLGGETLARWLKPITIIGQDALHAFVFHIFVIFIIYRHLLGLWQKIPYEKALQLALLLLILTPIWIRIRKWVLKKSSSA